MSSRSSSSLTLLHSLHASQAGHDLIGLLGLQKLPEFRKGMIPPLTGWRDYFGVRLEGSGPENDDGKLVLEPPLIDGALMISIIAAEPPGRSSC